MTLLEGTGLYAGYGSGRHHVPTIHGVDFHIGHGDVVTLLGESGSGKSTLARAIVGLVPITGGQVWMEGRDVTRHREGHFRRAVQMVFQSPGASLNPAMTIGETLREAAALLGRGGVKERIERLTDQTGLARGWMTRRPRELSGGQLQRVALARALAVDPSVLIADEITSALDPSVQAAILNLLADIRVERSLALLFITHDLGIARHLGGRVMVMRAGRVVEAGEAAHVLHAPEQAYTAELLAAEPRL